MHAHPKLVQLVLSILIILFVSGCGGSARTFDLARACIVTKQPDPPFVPPAPYPVTPDANSFWLGTNALWTALPLDGTWKGLSHYTPNDPTFRQVTFWWRQGYDAHAEPQPNLTVTGTRLDLSATPLLSGPASNGWVQPDQPFMDVGINVPTLGCWRITGTYQGQELSYTVLVTQ